MIAVKKNSVPKTPGVYIFKKGKTPLYIGKAANLKKRIVSYFRKDVGEKIWQMLAEATKLEWIETSSEVEAFLKEAELIKKYRPKYNYLLRDDKNYFYVGITNPSFLKKTSGWQAKEHFPRIFITHQPLSNVRYIGPFTSGTALKSVLRLLRRIFPYCTCKTPHKRPCLNSEIGRCPGYCCLAGRLQYTNKLENVGVLLRAKKEYGENIKNIIAVLSGKKKRILTELKRQMNGAAKNEDFEKAAKIRDQIEELENIFSHQRFLEAEPPAGGSASQIISWQKQEEFIRKLLGAKNKISRAEGYDISNISGTEATGSMVVFIDGIPAKSEYRKFRIKTVKGANDVAMLKEVIRRRLAHPEWLYPELMLFDGGKPQLNATITILRKSDFQKEVRLPKIAALAKRQEELYTENSKTPIRLSTLPQNVALFFQRVRDESHRFAKKYHHKLRETSYRTR